MLTVEKLSAAYAGIRALRDVGLRIDQGEMVALIGPNGAGKSTLLNCLSGMVPTTSGSIILEGNRIEHLRAHRIARSGLLQVPEGRQVLADLSVEENLLLGGLARARRTARYGLEEVFAMFPILRERRNQTAGSLSGGEQQMLAIGRALMGAPRLLLLDEPSLGLAPVVTDQVFRALQQLNSEGLTILLVEQNARRALQATTRAYILEQGRIVLEGPSSQLALDARVVDHYLGKIT